MGCRRLAATRGPDCAQRTVALLIRCQLCLRSSPAAANFPGTALELPPAACHAPLAEQWHHYSPQVPLDAPGPGQQQQRLVPIKVWEWAGEGADEGPAAADWLTKYLGVPARLVRFVGGCVGRWCGSGVTLQAPAPPAGRLAGCVVGVTTAAGRALQAGPRQLEERGGGGGRSWEEGRASAEACWPPWWP